jgi:ribosome maturation factor RimP
LLPAAALGKARRIQVTDGIAMTDQEERIVRETGIDARIAAIVEPVVQGLGYRLVRVRLSGQNGLTLQIMAERADGTMTVEDCEELSRALSPVLDVEDPVDRAYHLEISSPGIDRPLVRRSDFDEWRDHLVRIETSVAIGGRKRVRGTIAGVGETAVTVVPSEGEGEGGEIEIPFSALASAKLVLTDDLVREALKEDRRMRRERKKHRGGEPPEE